MNKGVIGMNWQRWLFVAATLVLLFVQLALVVVPIQERRMPVELDDSLTYIVKAVQYEECFAQDCQGLLDIKAQLGETGDTVDWQRFVAARNFLHIYHLGHSAAMTLLHSLGVEWEAAFDLTRVMGALVILCGIVLWIHAFWGTMVASLALLLVAFSLFPEQGIHIVTPSNITVGVALLLLAMIVRQGRHLEWFLLGGTLTMLSLHPFSVVLAVLVWGFYFLMHGRPWPRRGFLFGICALILAAAAYWAQHNISTPMLAMPFNHLPEGWQGWAGYRHNIVKAVAIVKKWADSFGGIWMILPVLTLGVALNENPALKRRQWMMMLLVAAFLLVSLAMVFPPHAALLFRRLWVFAALLGMGLFAKGICEGVLFVFREARSVSWPKGRLTFENARHPALVVAVGAITLVAVFSAGRYVLQGSTSIQREIDGRIARHEFDLQADQVNVLLERMLPGERVFYTPHGENRSLNAVPALFYFSHGAMTRGAVLEILLENDEAVKRWTGAESGLRYLVGWTPLMKLPNARRSGLVLDSNGTLVVERDAPFAAKDLAVRFRHDRAEEVSLVATDTAGQQHQRTAKMTRYWTFPLADLKTSLSRVTIRGTSSPADLEGLRIEQDQHLRWPWGKGVRVIHVPADPAATPMPVSMDAADLAFAGARPLRVLDDRGALMLVEFD